MGEKTLFIGPFNRCGGSLPNPPLKYTDSLKKILVVVVSEPSDLGDPTLNQ